MIIKKFQARTEEEAMNLARLELGDNIVILNTKKDVKPKGLFGMFKPRLVEVTFAKEEETEYRPKNSAVDIKATIASVDKLRAESESKVNTEEPKKESAEVNKKLDSIQSLLEEKLKRNEDNTKSVEAPAAPVEVPKAPEKNPEIMEFIKILYNTMIDNEVDEKYANQMTEEIERSFEGESNIEYMLSHIYQKMILKFGKLEYITPSSGKGPKVVFFIGPTGVGKTTTLAKIASMLAVLDNKKVALFTADTYRIAATNQLETYADILKTPFHIIYTTDEIKEYYENYKNYDYILVDTAGHSHHNEEQKKMMNEIVHSLDDKAEKEVYLVLSATTKYKDLISIADSYKELTDYKLIFTKLDETSSLGNLLNIRIHTGAPLSYVTCGQNVPDDIEKFSPQDTVRKLLGGNA